MSILSLIRALNDRIANVASTGNLELIWAGFKNKEIGHRLKISVKTVEAHRANMMKKLRVSNTAQLLKAAIKSSVLKIR